MRYALLNQVYANSRKVDGVSHDDPGAARAIWDEYAAVFQEGLYDVIREEYDPSTGDITIRQYVSGGAIFRGNGVNYAMLTGDEADRAMSGGERWHAVTVDLAMMGRGGERIRGRTNLESTWESWARKNFGVVINGKSLRSFQLNQARQVRARWLQRARWGVYGLVGWVLAAGLVWVSANIWEEGTDLSSATRGSLVEENIRVETRKVMDSPAVSLPASDLWRSPGETEPPRVVEPPDPVEPLKNPSEERRLPSVETGTGEVIVSEPVRVRGRVSPVTGERISYLQADYDQVNSTVQDIVKNYLDYWNSVKSIADIFHPDRNMRMTLDEYTQTLMGAYEILPQFRETGISRDMFVAVMTAIIAQESGFDSGKTNKKSGAGGLSQILNEAIWDEFVKKTLFQGLVPPAGWSFEDGVYDGARSVYVGAAGLVQNLETRDEFTAIKRLHGAAGWPGDDLARMGLLYLNHYRGPNFQLANKAMALKKLFSSDDSVNQYYNPLYVNTRKVLAFLGLMAIDEKGRVIEVNEYASREHWQYYLLQINPKVVANLFDLNFDELDTARYGLVVIGDLIPIGESSEVANAAMLASFEEPDRVGGIDFDSSHMEFDIEGLGMVDCVANPNDPGCLQLDVSAEQILEMRQSLLGVSPEILQIRSIENISLFLSGVK